MDAYALACAGAARGDTGAAAAVADGGGRTGGDLYRPDAHGCNTGVLLSSALCFLGWEGSVSGPSSLWMIVLTLSSAVQLAENLCCFALLLRAAFAVANVSPSASTTSMHS